MLSLCIHNNKNDILKLSKDDVFVIIYNQIGYRCLITKVCTEYYEIHILDADGNVMDINKGIRYSRLKNYHCVYLGTLIRGEANT